MKEKPFPFTELGLKATSSTSNELPVANFLLGLIAPQLSIQL